MYSAYTRDQVIKFVTQHGNDIISAITDSGLFFPAVVSQLTVESKWGTSSLSAKYNNWAGIKDSTNPRSGSVILPTLEGPTGNQIQINASFATYPDFQTFLQDYIRILQLPVYTDGGVYSAGSSKDQILAIAAAGYSTQDPNFYLKECAGRIEACQDNYPWGKISASALAPATNPDSGLGMFGIILDAQKSINSVFGGLIQPQQ